MIFNEKNPLRKFKVGLDNQTISNCETIPLKPNEQITFVLARFVTVVLQPPSVTSQVS